MLLLTAFFVMPVPVLSVVSNTLTLCIPCLPVAEEEGVVTDGLGPPAFACARGAPRQSSLNAMDAKNKLGKKKPGLLKGIGSMFR